MDNKTMLEGILWDLKVLSDLSLHGSIESSTKIVHSAFVNALDEILTLQNELYLLMSSEGMYNVTNVAESKLEKTKNKFQPCLKEE